MEVVILKIILLNSGEKNKMNASRSQNMDFLRIVAMWMILTMHFFGWGGAVNSLSASSINYYWVMPVYFLCQIGNSLFFLLSGYFLSTAKLKKGLFLERKAAFYSFSIALISLIFVEGGIEQLVKSAFPVIFHRYWFLSVYLVVYFLSYVLVPGLNNCSQNHMMVVLLALLINNTFVNEAQYTMMEALACYVAGYYIRKFEPFESVKLSIRVLLYVGSFLLYCVERVIVLKTGLEHSVLDERLRYIIVFISAVFFFSIFIGRKIGFKWPSKISSNVFAVYLITANPSLTQLIYVRLLHIEQLANKYYFFGYYVCVNILFFAISVAIDKVVTKINNYEVRIWDKIIFTKIRRLLKVQGGDNL